MEMETTQECYVLSWTNPGSGAQQNHCGTATSSLNSFIMMIIELNRNTISSKLDEQDMLSIAEKVRMNL